MSMMSVLRILSYVYQEKNLDSQNARLLKAKQNEIISKK
jgi:hypothetical protein